MEDKDKQTVSLVQTDKENLMQPKEAGEKGEMILEKIKEIYQLVEWGDEDDGGGKTPDPYVQIVLHKSGQLLVKTYKDAKPTEFKIDELLDDE